MDPTKSQSDSPNDTNSLEGEDKPAAASQSTAPADASAKDKPTGEDDITDATGESGKTSPTPAPFQHRSFIKRLWDKFNIYLLLFILVLVIAIGLVVTLTLKGREDTQKIVTTQALSQDDLKQLANTDVTVGQPKQILTVQANAVFAGAVLIRGGLEVAGDFKLGGTMELNNLTVSGATTLAEVAVSNITVNNNLSVQGTLALRSGISVAGQSNFTGGLVASGISTGSLQLTGDLNLTHHITAGGTIPGITKGTAVGGGGTVSLSGSDTSGSIAINTGTAPPAGCFAIVAFSEAFDTTPHVIVTPIGAAAAPLEYYVTRSTTGFSICSVNSAAASQTFGFDYVVLG